MTVTVLYQDGPWDGITEAREYAAPELLVIVPLPRANRRGFEGGHRTELPEPRQYKVGRYVRTELVVYRYAGDE